MQKNSVCIIYIFKDLHTIILIFIQFGISLEKNDEYNLLNFWMTNNALI